jgi:hypothetical protein
MGGVGGIAAPVEGSEQNLAGDMGFQASLQAGIQHGWHVIKERPCDKVFPRLFARLGLKAIQL